MSARAGEVNRIREIIPRLEANERVDPLIRPRNGGVEFLFQRVRDLVAQLVFRLIDPRANSRLDGAVEFRFALIENRLHPGDRPGPDHLQSAPAAESAAGFAARPAVQLCCPVVTARIEPPDVIAHDDEDVRFFVRRMRGDSDSCRHEDDRGTLRNAQQAIQQR